MRINSPYFIFGSISALCILTIFLALSTIFSFLFSFIIAVNLTTFVFYGYDKFSAKNSLMRVPEWNLHALGILGGTVAGLLAQQFFRHKTHDKSFRPTYIAIFVVQGILLLWWIFL